MLKRDVAPRRPVVGVELPAPVPHLDQLPLLEHVIKVTPDHETPVLPVEPEVVVTPLVACRLERERLVLGDVLARGPPDADAAELVVDLLVVVHGEGDGVDAVLGHVGLEPARLGGGGGAEVGVDGGVALAPVETLAGELVEGDLDVGGEETEELGGTLFEGASEVTREILFENGFHEHQTCNY